MEIFRPMTNTQTTMTNVMSNDQIKSEYDLQERTSLFSEKVIDFCRKIKQDLVTKPLISQLVRSGTSIGANYSEADEAGSKKDFINKMSIAHKEIKETKYWLRMIAYTMPETKDLSQKLWKEAEELNLIFSTIIRKTKNNAKSPNSNDQ